MAEMPFLPSLATVPAETPTAPPPWALLERFLIDTMNEAAVEFVERYTRADGTLVWRDEWPGMDGSDDAYESFHNFPLFYALGGSEKVHDLSRKEWDAITRQFTAYGQIYREFDAYYDWMHHGESYIYIYYFGLADPTVKRDVDRALRFAGMYTGEDPEAPNYDPVLKLIRSPINGSRGPRHQMSAEDWVTHRPILAHYPAPYEDIPGVTGPIADWNDDAVFAEILKLMNRRMAQGDVPLNLTATSLVTHAYLYTGEEKYRRWVLDYVQAWRDRAAANGGLLPDNVGLSGKIGECMEGKWWGGYYGWRWPHGAMNILESALIAGMNATLLTGDLSWLDFPRSQLDGLWALGREEEGVWKVPHRHGDQGWYDYRPPDSRLYVQLWYLSQEEADLERLLRLWDRNAWNRVVPGSGKGDQLHAEPWFAFLRGENPGYPEAILQSQYLEMCRRLDVLRHDDGDPREWDVHHWQEINPVRCEGLVQLTLGGPQIIYHGGLLHCRVRYFDPAQRRAGLPPNVAALVRQITPDHTVLQLINLHPLRERPVILQAGAFGEHQFTDVRVVAEGEGQAGEPIPVHSKWLQVHLAPGSGITLDLGLRRFANRPTYATPWSAG